MELVETREILGEWKLGHQTAKERQTRQAVLASRPWIGQVRWWPLLQKIAAGFLIVVGVVSILQYMGYLGGKRLVISERQLTETVQDMIVNQQTQERPVDAQGSTEGQGGRGAPTEDQCGSDRAIPDLSGTTLCR